MLKKENKNTRTPKYIGLLKRRQLLLSIGLLLVSISVFSQADSTAIPEASYISGKVLDAATKEPIAAAQIQNLNYKAAATSDENGEFKIMTISKNDMLLVRAIDYNQTEIPLQSRTELTVYLYKNVFSDNYKEFDNIAGTSRPSFSTNSAANITGKEDLSMHTADDILHSFMGGNYRAISRSGTSELGSALFMRGLTSVHLNSQPLIIVDGVIWNNYFDVTSLHAGYFINPLSHIDKNDIQSISVVKDGTSLYGSKGANGVILIRTKRGEDMATKIAIHLSSGIIQSPDPFPMMNGDQFKVYVTDLLETQGLTPQTIGSFEYLNEDPTSSSYNVYHNTTDWEDEIYDKGSYQSANISVNGGDERALYAFTIGYTMNNGSLNTTNMQRLNTRFNADFFLSDNIDMGLNVAFTNIDKILLDDGVNFYTSPGYLALIKADFLNPYSYTVSGDITTDLEDADVFDVGNPVAIIENALNINKRYRLNLGLKPVMQLTENLSISNQFDYSLFKVKESHYDPILGTAERYIDGFGFSENLFQNQLIKNDKFFNDAQLKYDRTMKVKHHLNSFIGLRYIYNSFHSDFAEGHNSGSDQKRNLLNEEVFKTLDGLNTEIKSLSLYANANYSYNKLYFLTVAAAFDASSKFGSDIDNSLQMFGNSWGFFPSVNAAWLISSESFMANVPFINLLKLRAGYGLSGNDGIEPYEKTAYFSTIQFIDRANGLYISNIGNSQLQWETSTKMNLGIDMGALNNMLSLSVDVYSNSTDNLLQLKQLPEIAGTGYYWVNGGKLANTGFELSAKLKVLNLQKIQWELGTSLGHYENRIVSLPEGDFVTSFYNADILTSVDNPAGVFYGYQSNGVFSTTAEAEAANLKVVDEYGIETYFGAGDVHFTDLDENGIIDEDDRIIIGDPNPDLYGYFNSALSFANFTLDAIFTFSYGNDVYNYLRANLESGSSFTNQTTAMLNRWSYENQDTEMPKAYFGDPMGNARFSDRWIEDGSYLKLKTISLTYKVPVNSSFFDQLTVWASVNNLFTLTNYLGYDPEFAASNSVLFQGIDMGLMPSTRSYFIGIKLNL